MTQLLLALLVIMASSNALGQERLKWQQGDVLPMALIVGLERKLIFPEKVRLAMKPKYAQMFKSSLIDTLFFITAKLDFNEKVTFQGLDSGRFYIIRIFVSADSPNARHALLIHLNQAKTTAAITGESRQAIPGQSQINAIDLVQYASQRLYAPSASLIEPMPGIKQVTVKRSIVANLYRGGTFKAHPLASWHVGGALGFYVTALKLENQTQIKQQFKPCRIRGDFYSATAQFSSAHAKGHKADFTVIYLLSRLPFAVEVKSYRLLCV